MEPRRVGVLFGGSPVPAIHHQANDRGARSGASPPSRSDRRSESQGVPWLESAESCARALERLGHEVVRIPVDANLDRRLRQANLDVAFLVSYGPCARSGCVQGLLELLRIPYTGSGVLASALATDRLKFREILRLHNIAAPPYYALAAADAAQCTSRHGAFGFPVVVKPRREPTGAGTRIVHDVSDLPRAVREALRFDDELVVERWIRGRQVCVALLGGRALGAIEIKSMGEFGGHRSKDPWKRADCYFPARLSPTRYQHVLRLAEEANRVLGCTGPSQVDLLATEGDNEYVIEVNPLPEMAPDSLLAKIAAAAGYDYDRLVEAILAGARIHTPGRSTNQDLTEPTSASLPRNGVRRSAFGVRETAGWDHRRSTLRGRPRADGDLPRTKRVRVTESRRRPGGGGLPRNHAKNSGTLATVTTTGRHGRSDVFEELRGEGA